LITEVNVRKNDFLSVISYCGLLWEKLPAQ